MKKGEMEAMTNAEKAGEHGIEASKMEKLTMREHSSRIGVAAIAALAMACAARAEDAYTYSTAVSQGGADGTSVNIG